MLQGVAIHNVQCDDLNEHSTSLYDDCIRNESSCRSSVGAFFFL